MNPGIHRILLAAALTAALPLAAAPRNLPDAESKLSASVGGNDHFSGVLTKAGEDKYSLEANTKPGWTFIDPYELSGPNGWNKNVVNTSHKKRAEHVAGNLADIFSARIYGGIEPDGQGQEPKTWDWSLEGQAQNDYLIAPDEIVLCFNTSRSKEYMAKASVSDDSGVNSDWTVKPLQGSPTSPLTGSKTLTVGGKETPGADWQAPEPGRYLVEAKQSDNANQTDSALLYVVKVELDSVSPADHIGDKSDTSIFATTQQTGGNATIQLKITPTVELPGGFVKWVGGTEGGDQLQRLVSRSGLVESLPDYVTANGEWYCPIFKGQVYVYKGNPPGEVDIDLTRKRDDSIMPAGNDWFGVARWLMVPDTEYDYFYVLGEKKWEFFLARIEGDELWGLNSRGRTDVPNAAASPFPLGMGMPPDSTEQQKKDQAVIDLTPHVGWAPTGDGDFVEVDGITFFLRYWSSAAITYHELFHLDDWKDNYLVPTVRSFEYPRVDVTTAKLVPQDALRDERENMNDKLMEKDLKAAYEKFSEDGAEEKRAYLATKPIYEALVNAIKN